MFHLGSKLVILHPDIIGTKFQSPYRAEILRRFETLSEIGNLLGKMWSVENTENTMSKSIELGTPVATGFPEKSEIILIINISNALPSE